MSIQIIDGSGGGTLLTVDPTSKALRGTLYDSAGNEIAKAATGSYIAAVNIRQTAASVAGVTVWAMRNTGALTAFIRRVFLCTSFDGTAVLATTLRYEIERFTAATPTGGTTVVPSKKRTSYPTPSVGDIRFIDTGLTTAGVTFEAPFYVIGIPISVTGGVVSDKDFAFSQGLERYSPYELAVNEGLCIRLNTAAVIGMSLRGSIEWDER